jgi:hypothetical protein
LRVKLMREAVEYRSTAHFYSFFKCGFDAAKII